MNIVLIILGVIVFFTFFGVKITIHDKDKKQKVMEKTTEELKKLNTKNLLRYYKSERRRFYGYGYWCSCGCSEIISSKEQKYKEHKNYLDLIKTELNLREHIYLNKSYE